VADSAEEAIELINQVCISLSSNAPLQRSTVSPVPHFHRALSRAPSVSPHIYLKMFICCAPSCILYAPLAMGLGAFHEMICLRCRVCHANTWAKLVKTTSRLVRIRCVPSSYCTRYARGLCLRVSVCSCGRMRRSNGSQVLWMIRCSFSAIMETHPMTFFSFFFYV
jgi:hypothetical protein